MRKLLRRALVLGVVLAVAGGVGVATGAIPDSGGTINGCYTKVGGILRVVDTDKNQKCISSVENPISWGQRGPQGDPGPQGDTGPAGTTGQDAKTVWSTDGLQLEPATGDVAIPGLKQTVDVPPDSMLLVNTDGGVSFAPKAGTWAYLDIKLIVDGVDSVDIMNYRRMYLEGKSHWSYDNWSFGHAFALPPGQHTFEVKARVLSSNAVDGDIAVASDPYNNPVAIGQLTVETLKR
jgi:hypothetical protein